MTVVYLSGKMTGLEKSEYEKRFNRAEDFYTSCGLRLWTVKTQTLL